MPLALKQASPKELPIRLHEDVSAAADEDGPDFTGSDQIVDSLTAQAGKFTEGANAERYWVDFVHVAAPERIGAGTVPTDNVSRKLF